MNGTNTSPRRSAEDVAFVSYLSTLATLLLIGGAGVLVLDVEGDTKVASAVALLLPAVGLIAMVVYAVRRPLQPLVPAAGRDAMSDRTSSASTQTEQVADL
jgi:hypothetical protein